MAASSAPDATPPATVVFVGHQGSGKSTAVGNLLGKLDGVDKRTLERVERETSNRPTSRYSWVVDRLRVERERGTTLDLKLHRLVLPPLPSSISAPSPSSPRDVGARVVVTLIDTPGHPDCLKSTIAGITQADVVVLVVDSRPAVMESPSCAAQTPGLAQLAAALANTRNMIVAVNFLDVAMDADTDMAEQRFHRAVDSIREKIREKIGKQADPATYLPLSATEGYNLVEPHHRLAWWGGPTLTEAIAGAVTEPTALAARAAAAAAAAAKPLRIPLIGVYKVGGVGTVPAGRLAGGSIRRGTSALLLPPPPSPSPSPSATSASTSATASAAGPNAPAASASSRGDGSVAPLAAAVRSLESFHDPRSAASVGDWVGLAVKGVHREALGRGCVVSDAEDRPARLAESFTVTMRVLRLPTSQCEHKARGLHRGYVALVHVHTAQAPCRLVSFDSCKRKGKAVEPPPSCLLEGDTAVVQLQPLIPLTVEPYSDYPALGRFVVRAAVRNADAGPGVVGAGVSGGGGGDGGGMTPVIVALGRVEAVKYVEPASVATSPSPSRPGSRRT